MPLVKIPRHHLTVLLILFSLGSSNTVSANPGDTTWVTVFSQRKLTHHGNYDTTAAMPVNKRYRKIRLHYILGRYACPPSTQYCGSWDYTTQIYSLPKNRDTVEIARVITPYATDWLQKNKSHDFIVDVTDYATVLEDSTRMRFRYDGYSWGFTLTLKLEFIEGIPAMDALNVKNIYDGYFAYGDAAKPIENHLSAKTLSYTGSKAFIKNSVSGHGADNTGCSEFCDKYYQLNINNIMIAQKQIWRDDCGHNPVFAQTGTWIFNRSNWCPGAVVWPIYHDLATITSSAVTFTADINMQPYTNANPSGGYNFVSQLISYSNFNHANDVSIEDIIAPSANDNFIKQNPACSNPVLRIKNTGGNPVFTVAFEYGISGKALSTYTWSGLLNPLEVTEVILPSSTAIMARPTAERFEAHITSVNSDQGDSYADNNYYYSATTPVSTAPKDLVIKLATNKSTHQSSGFNETGWQLFDANDQLIAQRTDAKSDTVYQDAIDNLPDGCYKFVVTDKGCDGYQWWYYAYYPSDPGYGGLRIDQPNNSPVFYFPGDVGCGFTKHFYVGERPEGPGDPSTGLTESSLFYEAGLYPNPAETTANLFISLKHPATLSYEISDLSGKVLSSCNIGTNTMWNKKLDLLTLPPGLYLVHIKPEGAPQQTRKLLVK